MARSKERNSDILERFLNASLVPKDASVDGATKLLHCIQPEVGDFLRLNVN